MTVLYAILGIILFFVVIFSINLGVIIDYGEATIVKIKWLFVKITVFDSTKPKKEKKPKKKKNDKKESSSEASPKKGKKGSAEGADSEKAESTDEKADESKPVDDKKANKKKQGNSLIKQIYLDHGYDGLEKMLRALGRSISGFFGKLYKTLVIDEMYITMVTAGSDAADTAIKHGKLCSWLYPVLGKVVSTCKVKKYDFDISTDFLASKSSAAAYVRLHVTPITITNAIVVLAFQLLFKILFKILFSKKKSDKSKKIADAVSESVAEVAEANTK
ncbi:MAG: hypothetical protein E7533_01660 [Ruminococcaceae bacterium]|nr:hypothetical protein [Oscillospiraceae bacterium]